MFDIESTKEEQKEVEDLVNSFIKEVIHQHNPKFNLKFHDQSWILNTLLKPIILLFNPKFYSRTSLYFMNTLWVPNGHIHKNKFEVLQLLAHEYVHAHDRKKLSQPLFYFLYLFPQILFVPFLLLSMYSIWFLIPAVVSILPIPAYFRYKLEYRAFLVNKVFNYHIFYMEGAATNEYIVWLLTSFKYYKAWPFKNLIRIKLEKETISNQAPYKEIVDFLRKRNLITL